MDGIRTLNNFDVKGKTVLYRSPYDIGTILQNDTYILEDDSRIKATIPTLQYLMQNNCKIVIITYVKRPEGKIDPALSTKPHAKKLSELLNHPVKHIAECIGPEVDAAKTSMQPGDIIMLENTRFHPEDAAIDPNFSKELTKGCDVIVYDGFPEAHRQISSTVGILQNLPSCAGYYFEKEYNTLSGLLNNPQYPFTLVIGGAKASDKGAAIYNLYEKVANILIGGVPANILLKAQDVNIQASLTEDFTIDKSKHEKVTLPLDVVIGNSLENPTESKVVNINGDKTDIPEGWAILDIGPQTISRYKDIIRSSKTVFWSGAMGLFEKPGFDNGTKAIAESMSESNAQTIAAGGDTIESLKKFGAINGITNISLAGGATLEFLGKGTLPVLKLLQEKE